MLTALLKRPAAYERAWIPPTFLLLAQGAHGLSWVLLIRLAQRQLLGFSFPGLAWIHLVALGYLTLVSLAVLFHVVPGTTGVDWLHERLARFSLWPFTIGAAILVTGFWSGQMPLLPIGGGVLAIGLAIYLGLAGVTLARAFASKNARVLARAYAVVLVMLALTALLGLGMALALGTGFLSALLAVGPALHAHLGVLGWLTLLVIGVSMRTFRRLSGRREPPDMRRHAVIASAVVLALVLLGVGFVFSFLPALALAGAAMAGVSLAYAADAIAMMRGAPEPHRPPQAFVMASALYFPLAAALGLGVLFGHPTWQAAYAFVALAGFLMQMVNGHLHHIGVRLLATLARGEEDETEPADLLNPTLSWLAFGLSQLAVVGGTLGLLASSSWLVMGAGAAGLGGWLAMAINVAGAFRRARALQPAVDCSY